MPFVETPLTQAVVASLASGWSIQCISAPQRLCGGEESAAYRIGSKVVRVGPAWRGSDELEWCFAVAQAAAEHVPEAVAPLLSTSGATVLRVDGRPISVWPFVDGQWVDDQDAVQRSQAADLLARLHTTLADVSSRFSNRPLVARRVLAGPVDLDDPSLDQWLADFDAHHRNLQPLHGDFYAGNMLAKEGHIVALLDWDEALIGPPERELAWAAWEFGNGLWADSLDGAHEFVAAYWDAGGPGQRISDHDLRQLIRQRIRNELRYEAWARSRELLLNPDDVDYYLRQIERFQQLKP